MSHWNYEEPRRGENRRWSWRVTDFLSYQITRWQQGRDFVRYECACYLNLQGVLIPPDHSWIGQTLSLHQAKKNCVQHFRQLKDDLYKADRRLI